jgi:hypothetical protein
MDKLTLGERLKRFDLYMEEELGRQELRDLKERREDE